MTIKILGSELEGAARRVGTNAHAEGYSSMARGLASHAEGEGSDASGEAAHAEGFSTNAIGAGSHAEGYATATQGTYAHAEGSSCFASGSGAHAEGSNSGATATSAHAEGNYTAANGNFSHAGGNYAKADAVGSWARSSIQPTVVSASRAQVAIYNMAVVTTNTAYTTLTFDGQAVNIGGATQNVLVIPTFSNYLFNLTLTARRPTVAASSQGWVYNGLVARDSGAVRMVGSATQVTTWNDGSSLGTPELFVDTTSNYFRVRVSAVNTGATHWHGVLMVNEFSSTS